jgi:signal transduction histidine kinase/FixJ family two-component response regulator
VGSSPHTLLRVLLVEDSDNDAELILRALREGGYQPRDRRVDTPGGMAEALDGAAWDVVLADYKLPGFSGLAALRLVQERRLDVPFILVSGVIGEDVAVEAMRAGAHDYVMKRNLARLPAAIARELGEAEVRRERRRAEEALRRLAHTEHFLASASASLAELLDDERVLVRAASLCVPELADVCTLLVPEPGGAFARVTVGIADERPPEVTLDHGGAVAAFIGEYEILPRAPIELLTCVAGEAHAAALTARGPWAALRVALRCRGRPGALLLLAGPRRPAFDAVDTALAQELAHRAAMAIDNARLYRETQDAVRARDEFLSIASHELRTPLTPLRLQVEDLLTSARSGRPQPPGRVVESLDRAMRQVDRLTRLVANLLDVSRIAAGRLTLERSPVELGALVREVVQRAEPELQRARCSISVDAPTALVGSWDRLRVEQVVTNLLSNAIKYGAGKPIEIAMRRDGARAMLQIHDHGIGIAPDQMERIFGRFERAVSEHAYGGLGLGLYIVRQFVEAHGGSVSAESRPGTSATFTVELPLD